MTKAKKSNEATRKAKQRKTTTTRSTAGPGFDFEDRVAAWLLLKILSGQPLPSVEGSATRLQTQTDALGWLIDDLLVTTTVASDDQRHLAISCKSNVQVSAAGLPRDFAERAWKQWFGADARLMKRGHDHLLLATRGRHPQFQATWSEIKLAASNADEALGLARIRGPASHRRIFESVSKPAKYLDLSVTDTDVLALIQSIDVAPLDFHISGSEDESAAVARCRTLLVNGTLAEGRRLWAELVGQCRTARLGNGTIDIADLWRDLRHQFELKGHPDYLPSWERLKALTEDYRSGIQSELSSGYVLERKDAADGVGKVVAAGGASVVYGESGTGKSALVRVVLDNQFSKEQQIWFGPDEIAAALSEVERPKLGIHHPLLRVLDASPHAGNVLVIDAAERVSKQVVPKLKALVSDLLAGKGSDGKAAWRAIIIGQTEAWVSGRLQDLAGIELPSAYELEQLPKEDVRLALRATDKLRWLATHDDAVSALTNLRALGWVVEAAPRFEGQESTSVSSLTAIADRLWSYWTEGNPEVERLLMRLGEREASFEHSFALSELDGSDVSALGAMPKHCPVRRNARNRYEFQHDLASDWARFQWLKQFAHDTARWAALASNPLWNGALRMLGQFLLREQVGSGGAWDIAFESAERDRDKMPLAADILLDALCLDPEAASFLNERVEMLFADKAVRLIRLLKRFEHIASVPGMSPESLKANPSLSLYIEANLRTPIFGRWPAIAGFLTQHRDRAAALISPAVAALCERWLTSTPIVIGVMPTPLRKEFAELAYCTARELQFEQAKNTMLLGDFETGIYRAALLAVPELPDEVSSWALEMAQRRSLRPDMAERLREHHKQRAEEHRKRLSTDAGYRERMENRKRVASVSLSSGRSLPPWPSGPQRQVDRHFSATILRSSAVYPLMRLRPAVALEVLLAVIIEDSPQEPYGTRASLDDGLALEYDNESYPTAYWKSPIYAFLQINPKAALAALHQLIDFCTERWEADVRGEAGSAPPRIPIRLVGGKVEQFAGNYWVFNWSQTDSRRIGQMTSGLAALERWLCDQIDRGVDITDQVENLLFRSHSVAVLAVLINVGKYKPELFKGALRPLLAVHHLYLWDHRRVKNSGESFFDAFSWARQGEAIFQMAKEWILASHRKAVLRQIVPQLIPHDRELAAFVLASTETWECPEGEKQAVEFRILSAELDYRNYRIFQDSAGNETVEFQYPADVQQAIQSFQQQHAVPSQTLVLPEFSRRALASMGQLTAEQAAIVDAALTAIDSGGSNDLSPDMQESARVAVAVTLLIKAPEWLEQNPAAQQRARAIFEVVMATIGDEMEPRHARLLPKQSTLEFAAHVVVAEWVADSSAGTDEAVMRILTSGDDRAVQVLVLHAYQNRALLGARWWRLLKMGLLWSGLTILEPGYGDDESVRPRWRRWVAWLRKRSLSGTPTGPADIDPLNVAQRVEKFERRRWTQRYVRDRRRRPNFSPNRRFSGGLDTHFLGTAFFWLLSDTAAAATPAEATAWTGLLREFWAYEAWCRRGSVDGDDKDYKPLSHMLGSAIVAALARRSLEVPVGDAKQLWTPVLELGARGHHAIGSFLTDWFALITEATDIDAYAARWRPMVECILGDADWATGRCWHYGQRLERQVLGFGADSYLVRTPGHASLVGGMRDLYQLWAEKRLRGNEDNFAGFCGFLSANAGRVLRQDALIWIAAAIKGEPSARKWYRDRTGAAFMEFLDRLVAEHAEEISNEPKTRQALIDMVAHAVALQISAAFALQERVHKIL